MSVSPVLQVVLDLAGTFAFAVNGALTAIRAAKVDIVGVVTLGAITAVGGGAPCATFWSGGYRES
jgi:uncharacterized membrane protein YeiH